MLRILFFLVIIFCAVSCIKKKDIGPAPYIEFLDFKYIGPKGYDSADFKLRYIDSDGDLFGTSQNLFVKTFVWDAATNGFVKDLFWPRIIVPPADGYYDGKSIEGYIYLNEESWRATNSNKVKFEVYMMDKAGNKSNVVTSKEYTFTTQ